MQEINLCRKEERTETGEQWGMDARLRGVLNSSSHLEGG